MSASGGGTPRRSLYARRRRRAELPIELIDFVSALGYPRSGGRQRQNNPLNVEATPDDYAAEAKARNMNAHAVEFVDGSKTAVEMAAIGNATGLVPTFPECMDRRRRLDQLHDVSVRSQTAVFSAARA
ncbi:hypothetical protein ACFFYR_01705 [Paraburkholderia dipogonis]|uniref:hypothetical protein n=1 Tax=Paraburkholderia dipogonis TaxID=1211383 RepID=UPI0035E7D8B7